MNNRAIKAAFLEIDDFLFNHKQYWQLQAFDCLSLDDLPWPEPLVDKLKQLDLSDVISLKTDRSKRFELFEPDFSLQCIQQMEALFLGVNQDHEKHFTQLTEGLAAPLKKTLVGVKGRKAAQIQAFTNCLDANDEGNFLEWCAGKGHLGRYISAKKNCSVTSLEWQKKLCVDGDLLASKQSLKQSFVCVDAMGLQAKELVAKHDNVVALHACGDLHATLIQCVSELSLGSVYISPCCYNRIDGYAYQPISLLGRQAKCSMRKADLSLSLQAIVTAPQKKQVQAKSDEQVLWRLAFDVYQRKFRGVNAYLPLPSHSQPFSSVYAFFDWACDEKNLPLLPKNELVPLLAQARIRLIDVRRLELVQSLFQRLIELWLVLEKAYCLAEAGLNVEVLAFCPVNLSPRNLMIRAFSA